MKGKFEDLWQKHKELICYLFWGGATTAVNYAVYFLCTRVLQVHYLVSNGLSWVAAVAFAFVVNKAFVFASQSWKWRVVGNELWKFVTARIFSGLLETGILFVFVDFLHCPDGIVKVLAGIFVVLSNYIISKLFIFKKQA